MAARGIRDKFMMGYSTVPSPGTALPVWELWSLLMEEVPFNIHPEKKPNRKRLQAFKSNPAKQPIKNQENKALPDCPLAAAGCSLARHPWACTEAAISKQGLYREVPQEV